MSEVRRYPSAAAFRQALTDRLKVAARNTEWTLQQLQRHVAYDRLLQRLYREDQGWVLKGAAALVARDLGVRATIDIDVYRDAARDVAEAGLRAAAAQDIGDWFEFLIGGAHEIGGAAAGVRLPVTAYVGATSWVTFHVDLVGGDVRMTGTPEDVPALVRLAMPQVEQRGYRAYPLVDHVADKITATIERHRGVSAPSTRYKDLVDLVAIVTRATVEAEAQMDALWSQAERRGITLPDRFDVPDGDLWQRGYAAEAGAVAASGGADAGRGPGGRPAVLAPAPGSNRHRAVGSGVAGLGAPVRAGR